MKALTLHQPWAELVAQGYKHWETRSWPTTHRGLLAIHSSREWKYIGEAIVGCDSENEPILRPPFDRCLIPTFDYLYGAMSTGGIVGLVNVTSCQPAPQVRRMLLEMLGSSDPVEHDYAEQNLAFGDFSPGRWAWKLDHIVAIETHIVRGHQRLWTVPPDVETYIRAACLANQVSIETPPARQLTWKEAA